MTNSEPLAPLLKSTLPAKKTLDGLTTRLRTLLLEETVTSAAVDTMAYSPELYAECVAALPGLIEDRDKALTPATRETMSDVLGRRMATYPPPEFSESEWRAWWADWMDAFSDVPDGVVEPAMRQWVRSPEAFMPKPGQLRAIALRIAIPEVQAAHRAKAVSERKPPRSKQST